MFIWRDLEERAEVAADEVAAAAERAKVFAQLDPLLVRGGEDEDEDESLRLKLAKAFVLLGKRIDPKAATVAAGRE